MKSGRSSNTPQPPYASTDRPISAAMKRQPVTQPSLRSAKARLPGRVCYRQLAESYTRRDRADGDYAPIQPMLPTRLKVKVLVEATFAPVPLDRDPVQIANLEVAVKVYAAQPVVVAGLITHLCVEIDEAVETELNATVVKGTGSSISRIAAPTALTCVGEIGSGRGLRARLTMSEVPRIAEPAPT